MVVASDDTYTDGQTVGWQKDRSIICDRTHATITIILKQGKQNHLVASQTFIEKAFLNLICFNSSGDVECQSSHKYLHCQKSFTLTDFDFLGIEFVNFTLEASQSSLDPVGPSKHLSCLSLDAQKDVAGVPRKVRKLVN